MTSDSSQGGPTGGRPPANRSDRRLDQGDLWAAEPSGTQDAASATTSPAAATPVPATPAPEVEPEVVAPAPAAAQTSASKPVREAETVAAAPRPRREARAAAPAPARPAEDEYADYDDEDDYYEEPPELLSNPYVLAAMAVVGAIVLAVIVVLFFGRGGGDTPSNGITANGNATRTPTSTPNDGSPRVIGLLARSIAISTVREGPALSHLELGTLPANQDVDVVGRNEEATWFQIVFPSGTQLRGWVPETALRLPANVEAIVDVAEATPVSRPVVPTETPVIEVTTEPTPEDGGADIAVIISSDCAPGSDIVISIANAGTVALDGEPIEVIVSNGGIVRYQQSFEAEIAVGASASLNTGVPAQEPQMAVTVLLSDLDDVDASNNISACTVEGGSNIPPAIQTQQAQ